LLSTEFSLTTFFGQCKPQKCDISSFLEVSNRTCTEPVDDVDNSAAVLNQPHAVVRDFNAGLAQYANDSLDIAGVTTDRLGAIGLHAD
jgi:hypothetical protein